MRIYDLRDKEVVNVKDCKVLGCVVDVDFDSCTGCILALIVPGPGRICGVFGRDMEYVIPWKRVKCIGPDVILVDIVVEECFVKCKL